MTGHDVRLTDEQVALVRRLQSGQFGDGSCDPYEVGSRGSPWVCGGRRGARAHPSAVPSAGRGLLQRRPDAAPSDQPTRRQAQLHPVPGGEGEGRRRLPAGPPPPRPRAPSLTGPGPQVSRMVHAIKMGWIQPRRPRDHTPRFYDLWAREDPDAVLGRHKMHVPAPKLALPGHAESYNPPPEYLPSEEEVGLALGWAFGPLLPALGPRLTPVSTAPGVGAAGAGREEAQLLAPQVPEPAGRARVRTVYPGALRALPRPLPVPAAAQDAGVWRGAVRGGTRGAGGHSTGGMTSCSPGPGERGP